MQIQKGANAPITTGNAVASLTFDTTPAGLDVDVSAYLLTASGKVRGDGDMVFYNQPASPDGAVAFDKATSTFRIDTAGVAAEIERIAICVVVDGGSASALGAITLSVADGPSFRHETNGQPEAAIIVGEIYRRAGAWKMKAVGQGFAGGLEPLARSFGIDVAGDDGDAPAASAPVSVPVPAPAPTPAPAAPPATPPVNLSKVDLRKHKVGVSLAKHGITDVKADLTMVMDASGSMSGLYAYGVVQETVERLVPVALRMDADGKMDTWFYASECKQVEDLDESSMIGFIPRTLPSPGQPVKMPGMLSGMRNKSIGYGNNEPVVMNEILKGEPRSRTRPRLVLFVTDGGIDGRTSEVIKRILKDCSGQAVFWQFIGVGNADYGVLRDLDTIAGRKVDNAGFFSVDDLSRISDDDLYDRMLSEFPTWLKEVKRLGILRG
jgi:stress response protein SCP2